ncbi:MAG: tRNA 2-selenouridine(34) synthase MnmH, partial [Cyanobacteria bacterium P01_D01_bin.73]
GPCGRGGRRSSSPAALWAAAGRPVALLEGGPTALRGWVRQCVATPRSVITLGGMTGTAKTDLLGALAAAGEQTLDLEGLANHRGSSYGALGLPPQPSTEHFENLIAIAWSKFAEDRPIWIEAESRNVGSCRVPPELFEQMMAAPVVEVQRSPEERIEYLTQVYGESSDLEGLLAATERIRKRLGGARTKTALEAIQKGDAATAIAIVLEYYDRTYRYDLDKRPGPVYPVPIKGLDHTVGAKAVLEAARAAELCGASEVVLNR